jgi:hypothetical protein
MMLHILIAWSLFTTFLGLMAVFGWLGCEDKHKEDR